MSKEMVVSSSSHETKIAILEDGQVVEVCYEREKEYSLAGSIYKGRVTRILPGMQSAFVNIGLERDAFLYVSDFYEDVEEYDRIVTTVEDRIISLEGRSNGETVEAGLGAARVEEAAAAPTEPSAPRVVAESVTAPEETAFQKEKPRPFSRHSRRHRRRRQGFPDSKFARHAPANPSQSQQATHTTDLRPSPVILPGESLAKYKDRLATPPPPAAESGAALAEAPAAPMAEGAESRSSAPAGQPETQPATPAEIPGQTPLQAEAEWEAVVPPLPPWMERIPEEFPPAESHAPVESEPAADRQPEKHFAELSGSAPPVEEHAPEISEPGSPETAPSLESPAGDLDPVAAEKPESPEVSEPAASAPEMAKERKPAGGPEMPREAIVREGSRHPRYHHKPRWMARREAVGEETRRPRPWERESVPKPLIGDLLKEGQEIIVQVAKEPLGKKGARITSHIALPGRYVVYMPTLNHVGVSRKIASDEERQRLKRIILEHTRNLSGGFIVRTAGEGRSSEDLRQDILFLVNLWAEIKAKAEKAAAPALLHHDLDLVLRTLRDQLSEEFTTIWVDHEQKYEEILSLVEKFHPALVGRVRLYTKDVPLFEETGVQEEINKALRPKVWLKSGGYIVINQTEALVAIDINTGKFVGKSNRLEDTIVKTNIEAVQEIVRQIRLRDLGGIIVIDFIDMDERRNRQKVMSTLEEALKADRAPSKSLAFNEFGLVAITRKRVRQSLERTLCQPCSDCGGSGLVKSPTTVSLEILAEARKMAHDLAGKQVTLRVNPEVGKALKARDNTVVAAIEEITRKGVIIRNDPALHVETFYFD